MLHLTKRRIVITGLICFAVWPLLHIFVVHTMGLSPWKGFGWAMYCEPVPKTGIVTRYIEGRKSQVTPQKQQRLSQEANQFLKRFGAIGRQAKPDRYARAVFALHPDVRKIEIRVIRHGVDRRTARIVTDITDPYPYQREPPAAK